MRRTLTLFAIAGAILSGCRTAPPQAALDSEPQHPAPASPSPARSAVGDEQDEEASDDSEPTGEPETVEDDPEDGHDASGEAAETRPHPLDGWSDAEIGKAVLENPERLGSISLGQPSGGLLLNGIQATETPEWKPVDPSGAYGTKETIDYLATAIRRVHAQFPGTAPLSLGHISGPRGGRLSPHISHQSGRDVDISFFYSKSAQWYRRGTADNLDRARNWAFVRALVTETDVEMILVDHSIQAILREYAQSIGEDQRWLDSLFRGGAGLRAIIRHAPGHATHFHIRFYNPIAQETARRAYQHLVTHGLVPPVQDYVRYKAKKGDTLGKLAKRFGTSVVAIKQANSLKKSLIREKQVYLIPVKNSRPRPPASRLTFPPRRLPPAKAAKAAKAP